MRRSVVHRLTVALVAAVFVIPLIVLVTGSLRVPGLPPPRGVELIPNPASLESFRTAFEIAPMARSMVNSLIVAVFFVPLAVVASSWAGFAIALSRESLRGRLIALALLLMMVPVTALWLTRFVIFKAFGMVDSFWPLVLPALLGGSPLAVLLYAYAFGRIPGELFDASRLEGLSPVRIWWRVGLPLVRATTVAVAMLAFLTTWANFIDPLLYLNSEDRFTAPLTLRYLEQLGPTNWPVLLAGAAAVTAPAVLVFLLAQRFFLQEERGVGWLGR